MDNNFSRRNFLKKGIAAGVILPLSGMIFQSSSFAQSQPQQRSDRCPFLRKFRREKLLSMIESSKSLIFLIR